LEGVHDTFVQSEIVKLVDKTHPITVTARHVD